MPTAICGPLVYDTIMTFHGQFKNNILPDQMHILNVTFLAPKLRREFGGCGGNIAYNLKLLGDDPLLVTAVGQDFGPYRAHLEKHGIRLEGVRVINEQFTAQCFITTDLDNNQIASFHPGTSANAHESLLRSIPQIDFAIVSPSEPQVIEQCVGELAARKVPFIFDPGPATAAFKSNTLRAMIDRSTYVIVNEYELNMIKNRTGWDTKDIASRVRSLIITLGPKGSHIHVNKTVHHIPPAHACQIIDPTGCGDAYRAGLIFGITNGRDWPTSGRIASLMGALELEHPGSQNQHFERAQFAAKYKQQFGHKPD